MNDKTREKLAEEIANEWRTPLGPGNKYITMFTKAERDLIVSALRQPAGVSEEEIEARLTIGHRLKGCVQRRELPTWAEIDFAADALVSLALNRPQTGEVKK